MLIDNIELYSSTPQIILGFHGCDKSVANAVIKWGETYNIIVISMTG